MQNIVGGDLQHLDDEPLVHGLRAAVAAVGPATVGGDVAVLDLGQGKAQEQGQGGATAVMNSNRDKEKLYE